MKLLAVILCVAAVRLLYLEKITEVAVLLPFAIFFFFFGSLARFRRFKGLGFEAELWDDKQEEAAILIEKVKAAVGMNFRQLLLSKKAEGRIVTRDGRWRALWDLYQEVSTIQSNLSADFELQEVKEVLDQQFAFDVVSVLIKRLDKRIAQKQRDAAELIGGRRDRDEIDGTTYDQLDKKVREWASAPGTYPKNSDGLSQAISALRGVSDRYLANIGLSNEQDVRLLDIATKALHELERPDPENADLLIEVSNDRESFFQESEQG